MKQFKLLDMKYIELILETGREEELDAVGIMGSASFAEKTFFLLVDFYFFRFMLTLGE